MFFVLLLFIKSPSTDPNVLWFWFNCSKRKNIFRENFFKIGNSRRNIKLLVTGYYITADCHMPNRKEGKWPRDFYALDKCLLRHLFRGQGTTNCSKTKHKNLDTCSRFVVFVYFYYYYFFANMIWGMFRWWCFDLAMSYEFCENIRIMTSSFHSEAAMVDDALWPLVHQQWLNFASWSVCWFSELSWLKYQLSLSLSINFD